MQQQPSPRRQRVMNHPGVYYRDTPAGRRYEVTFLDSEGRRRWKTLDGGLREAQAALEEARGRRRRGERVAPARTPRLAEFADEWLEAKRARLRGRTHEKYEV